LIPFLPVKTPREIVIQLGYQGTETEDLTSQRPDTGWSEFKTDDEEKKDDAEFGEASDPLLVGCESGPGGVGADNNARHEKSCD
jgi:hypothetical protein